MQTVCDCEALIKPAFADAPDVLLAAQMLRDMTAAVDERCGGLLAGVLAPQSGLHSFNLLANSVVAEVDDALARSRPGA